MTLHINPVLGRKRYALVEGVAQLMDARYIEVWIMNNL